MLVRRRSDRVPVRLDVWPALPRRRSFSITERPARPFALLSMACRRRYDRPIPPQLLRGCTGAPRPCLFRGCYRASSPCWFRRRNQPKYQCRHIGFERWSPHHVRCADHLFWVVGGRAGPRPSNWPCVSRCSGCPPVKSSGCTATNPAVTGKAYGLIWKGPRPSRQGGFVDGRSLTAGLSARRDHSRDTPNGTLAAAPVSFLIYALPAGTGIIPGNPPADHKGRAAPERIALEL